MKRNPVSRAGFKLCIYGLGDPHEFGHVRYVGMALKPSRPNEHASAALKVVKKASYLINWVRKLQKEGRSYVVLVLEELPEGTTRHFLGFVEQCYIKALRQIGHHLTNVHEGGWGGSTTLGKKWTDEEKQRMRVIFKGRPLSEKHKAALRHPWSEARRTAHKSHNKGRPWPAARRAARETPWNKGMSGGSLSVEQRQKLSVAQFKRYEEHPEHATRHSEAMKRYYEERRKKQ